MVLLIVSNDSIKNSDIWEMVKGDEIEGFGDSYIAI
jgi:hypothetical protein